MNLFLSLAGNTRVADNYCPRPACHWNNAPWRTSCSKCGALTERGRAELDAHAHAINEHYDHTPGGVR